MWRVVSAARQGKGCRHDQRETAHHCREHCEQQQADASPPTAKEALAVQLNYHARTAAGGLTDRHATSIPEATVLQSQQHIYSLEGRLHQAWQLNHYLESLLQLRPPQKVM
jgi:hypothetical protein